MHVVDENGQVYEVLPGGTYREMDEFPPVGPTVAATSEEVAAFVARRADSWRLVTSSLPIARKALIVVGLVDETYLSDVGVPALVKALRYYDPERGSWKAFAFVVVKKAAIEARARAKKIPLLVRDISEQTPPDVGYIVSKLCEEDRMVLFSRFWADMSLSDIGALVGLGKSGVLLRIKRALARAREIHDAAERRGDI